MLKRIYIEITNICNLNCSFCAKTARQKRYMIIEEFIRILEQISMLNQPLPQLYLHIKGEPLLHKRLDEFLAESSKFGYKVNITTNGTLLSNQSKVLLDSSAVRQINISLHSFEREDKAEYALITNNDAIDSQGEYLRQVTAFADIAKAHGAPIVAFRLWRYGYNELDSSSRYSYDYIVNRYGNGDLVAHSGKESIKLADNIYLNFDTEFAWPNLATPSVCSRGRCLGGIEMLGILVDGTVTACCLDGDGVINLGNIYQTSLAEIMDSDRYRQLVNGFKGGNISEELCRKCTYRQRFNRSK